MKGRKTLMRSHLKSMTKRKVSDFLLREEGIVGNRSAFATAALVSTTALAMTLFVVPDADAGQCGGQQLRLGLLLHCRRRPKLLVCQL